MTTETTSTTSLLRHRAALGLLSSRVVGDIGDFLGLAALLLYAFGESGGLLGPGAVFAAMAAPALLVGIAGGRVLSRMHPGRGLVAAQVLAGVICLGLATQPSLWVTLAGVTLLGLSRTVSASLRMAALATSVPADLRQGVLAWSSTSLQVGQIVGYLGGAAIVASVGAGPALLLDAATFFIAAGLLVWARLSPAVVIDITDEAAVKAAAASPLTAVRSVLADRTLALLLGLLAVAMLTASLPETVAPALTTTRRVGWLMAATPAASAVGAALLASRRSMTDARILQMASVYGVTLLVLGAAIAGGASFGTLLVTMAASGLAAVWSVGVRARLASLDPRIVATVYAAISAAMISLDAIGALLLGVLAPVLGPAGLFTILGGLILAGGIVGQRIERRRAIVVPDTIAELDLAVQLEAA